MPNEAVTQSMLQELFHYNPETGVFTTKRNRGTTGPRAGERVGTYTTRDGWVLHLAGRMYPMHNLAWLYVHGEWPPRQLIKSDGDNRNIALNNLMMSVDTPREELTQARLQSLLDYDPDTGVFTWLVRTSKSIDVGRRAGRTEKSNSNVYISVDGVDYTAQRLAWLYVYGALPGRSLRFLDGNQNNLSISNLALPEFDARTPDGRRRYEKVYRHFEVVRSRDLRRDHGMTSELYDKLLALQGGVCAACRQPETAMRNGRLKALAVDHIHDETQAVRGLLCERCNTTAGKYNDDPKPLRMLADYFEKPHEFVIDGETVRIIKRGRAGPKSPPDRTD